MEINEAVAYAEKLGNKFNYTVLNAPHYRTFFIINVGVTNSVDIGHSRFRKLAAVFAEFSDALREMQLDIHRLLLTECREVMVSEDLALYKLIDMLKDIDLSKPQNFYEYLENLTNTAYATLTEAEGLTDYQRTLMEGVLFMALSSTKKLAGVGESTINTQLLKLLEGVEITFERKRKRA